MKLQNIARALGGEISGGQVLAPGPGHSPRDRSLAVRPSASAPDGLLVFSHSGDDSRLCRKHVRERLGLSPYHLDAANGQRSSVWAPTYTKRIDSTNDAARTHRALAIWRATIDLRSTPAWEYLQARGIVLGALPSRIHEVLRWHPRCRWGEGGTRLGCLVALWTDAKTGAPSAIHRRRIGAAGEKIEQWKALGPSKGCVIRLSPYETVTSGLVIGEGVETAL